MTSGKDLTGRAEPSRLCIPLSLAIWHSGAAGNFAEVHRLVAATIRPLAKLRERKKGYHITVVKAAMNLLGLPGGEVRSPLTPLTPEDHADLVAVMSRLGLLEPAAVR